MWSRRHDTAENKVIIYLNTSLAVAKNVSIVSSVVRGPDGTKQMKRKQGCCACGLSLVFLAIWKKGKSKQMQLQTLVQRHYRNHQPSLPQFKSELYLPGTGDNQLSIEFLGCLI